MKKCPCIDCICLPVCRNKPYYKMLADCDTLRVRLYNNNGKVRYPMSTNMTVENRKPIFSTLIKIVYEHMKPDKWHASFKDDGTIRHVLSLDR